jgi:hypothetical protein
LKLEIVPEGNGQWKELITRHLPGQGYSPVILPTDLKAQWLRVTTDTDCVATAFLHVSTPRRSSSADEARIFSGLATASDPRPESQRHRSRRISDDELAVPHPRWPLLRGG